MATFRNGQRIRIKESVSPNGEYGKYAGCIGKITNSGSQWDQSVHTIKLDNGEYLYSVGYSVLEHYTKTGVEGLEAQKVRLEKQLEEINDKIDFIKETGSTEFDPTEYKVYKTLKAFKTTGMTDIEKAKHIANLIKS